jgi:hypothetical protein
MTPVYRADPPEPKLVPKEQLVRGADGAPAGGREKTRGGVKTRGEEKNPSRTGGEGSEARVVTPVGRLFISSSP